MKLTVQHHHLRSTDELDSLIEEQIIALQPRLQIEEANVRLEHRHEESPSFTVRVHLVTPGPDVVAQTCDHTLPAAIRKVLSELEHQISSRALKRMRRVRSNLQEPPRMPMGRGRS